MKYHVVHFSDVDVFIDVDFANLPLDYLEATPPLYWSLPYNENDNWCGLCWHEK